ncbi:hypothetical protein CHS0354_032374 [Potamilus streckersoni]|uniref:Coiled-coil domain-containing protein 102A n=1 Tax=Potamilus streckersoni TaxID=2493646 RepID=A0AAE0TGN0_9BIVA|nr:hypothetical protein CHS0354_032374 [Potamilus streckersoni]
MNQKQSGQGTLPKGDVSNLRAVTASPPISKTPTPVPQSREKTQTPIAQAPNMDNDWDDREEIRLRELEEARARAAQMEKTMRWWSDCTANWREKWCKVRNERNKARDENRQLRTKLDSIINDCTALKREKDELLTENSRLKNGLNFVPSLTTSQDQSDTSVKDHELAQLASNTLDNVKKIDDRQIMVGIDDISNKSSLKTTPKLGSANQDEAEYSKGSSSIDDSEGSLMDDRVALIELKLDESQKTIIAERDEKTSLMKAIETLQVELHSMKTKYEEMKVSKQEAMLQITKLKEDHKVALDRMAADLEEESSNRSTMDRRLGDLRRELEKLQKENADEWGKKERLETERFGLERENKKLRMQIQDLEEQLERKTQHTSTVVDSDMRSLQLELSEKNKELVDLHHAHSKLKKALQERVTELEHTKRRAEQYELEVKKLRSRIDELRRDLSAAEDMVDYQNNNVRKVQRNNDELQEQVENLRVQLEHAQTRLRHTNPQVTTSMVGSIRSYSPNLSEHSAADTEDSDDDFHPQSLLH